MLLMSAEHGESGFFKKHRKAFAIGATIVAAAAALGGYKYFNREPEAPPPKDVGAVGTLLWIPAPEYIKYDSAADTINEVSVSHVDGEPGAGDDPEKWSKIAVLNIPKSNLEGCERQGIGFLDGGGGVRLGILSPKE